MFLITSARLWRWWDDDCCPRMTASICPELHGMMRINPYYMLYCVKTLCIKHSLHSEGSSVMGDLLEVFGAQQEGSVDSWSRLFPPDGSALGRGLPNFFYNDGVRFCSEEPSGQQRSLVVTSGCLSLTGVCRSKPSPVGWRSRDMSEMIKKMEELQSWRPLKQQTCVIFLLSRFYA